MRDPFVTSGEGSGEAERGWGLVWWGCERLLRRPRPVAKERPRGPEWSLDQPKALSPFAGLPRPFPRSPDRDHVRPRPPPGQSPHPRKRSRVTATRTPDERSDQGGGEQRRGEAASPK